MFIHQIVFKIWSKITGPWNVGHCDLHLLRSKIASHWFVNPKYDVLSSNSLEDTRPNHLTMKYRSLWPTFILDQGWSHWLIIQMYNIHPSNSLQDIIRQIGGPWNIGHCDIYIYFEVKGCITLTHYSINHQTVWSGSTLFAIQLASFEFIKHS